MWQVGDRPFTDIVYGNRNGFLTILTEPLSLAEEPFIVRQVGFPSRLISSLFPSEELAIKFLQEERNLKMDIANERLMYCIVPISFIVLGTGM